jgi:ERCC4-type nuclease
VNSDQPTLLLDPRRGSADLKPYLRALGARVEDAQQIPADVALVGSGPDGLMPVGIEYKLTATGDIFTSLADGRLTGTQLPRMLAVYPRRYLLIEGPTRVAEDGTLEHSPKPAVWVRAQGRGAVGWSAHEYWSRLQSIAEFFSAPFTDGRTEVHATHNKRESAAWIISLWRYWQKDYAEHASYRQWDQSRERGAGGANGNGRGGGAQHNSGGFHAIDLLATSDLPLVQQMASCIPGIGQGYSGYVARQFATPADMILADESAWREVECLQKLRGREGYRKIRFSKERIKKIRAQLWGSQV